MEERYDAKARRIRGILVDLGLDVGKIVPKGASAVGGPFVPAKLRDAGFERQVYRVNAARAHLVGEGSAQ